MIEPHQRAFDFKTRLLDLSASWQLTQSFELFCSCRVCTTRAFVSSILGRVVAPRAFFTMPQRTFEVVPAANNQFRPQRDDGLESRPIMTSKQAQKLYRQATRGPKRTKAEQRQFEKEEQERIKRELKEEEDQRKKELEASRARSARERKKAKDKDKADAERAARRRQGLPTIACRPSQDTISRFFMQPVAGKKRALETPAEEDDKENADPNAQQDDAEVKDNGGPRAQLMEDVPLPEPAPKRQKLVSDGDVDVDVTPARSCEQPQSPGRSEASVGGDFSGDEADADILAAFQLVSEAEASQCNAPAKAAGISVVPPPTTVPAGPSEQFGEPTIFQPQELPPTSTQLFVLGNIDLFPSASQEMRELLEEDQETQAAPRDLPQEDPPAPFLFSSQDFVMSTQDLCELEEIPEVDRPSVLPSQPTCSIKSVQRRPSSQKEQKKPASSYCSQSSPRRSSRLRAAAVIGHSATPAPNPSQTRPLNMRDEDATPTGTMIQTTHKAVGTSAKEPSPRKPFFTSSNRGAMNSLMEMRAVQESGRSFRLEEQARRLEQHRAQHATGGIAEAAHKQSPPGKNKVTTSKPSADPRPSDPREAQHVQESQETDYGDVDLDELETLGLLDRHSDYLDDDEDDDWTELL